MKILLTTEGSEFSRAAVEKCCEIFRHSERADIRILSAAEPVIVPVEPFAVSMEYLADAEKAALEGSRIAVATAEEQIRKAFPNIGEGLSTSIVKDKPVPAILEEAETWGADIIVMGSHGYGFWQRTFLGSVSNAIVHHAPCSVLVVRPNRSEKD